MWYKPLGSFKTNTDLRNFSQQQRKAVSNLRPIIPIAVIDDEPFAADTNLRAHGYKITQIGDIKRMDEVAPYRIVLCDLMGVGRHFDQVKQGGTLIEEIRNTYPAIIVVAYTGSSLNSIPARAAKDKADQTLKKDADLSEWKRVLDDLVQKAADPHFIWQRTRMQLCGMELDTKEMLVLEDAYVRAVLSGDESGGALKTWLSSSNDSADVRAVVQGLISSAIFRALVG